MEKLYVVTRRDMPPGDQGCQSLHSAFGFAAEHREIWARWYEESNTLALLSVADEAELEKYASKAEMRGLKFSRFREPDMKDALTSITFEPAAHRLLRNLPKLFDE